MPRLIVTSMKERGRILLQRGFGIHAHHGHEPTGLWSAVAMLARGERGDAGRANRVILEWCESQNRDILSPQYGGEQTDEAPPLYDNGSFPKPTLFNASAAPPLAVIFRRFRESLWSRTRRACMETMEAGLFEFLSRDLCLRGHNQHIGMTTGMIIYGALLGQPAIMKKGLYRLLHYLQIGAYLTPMDGYNSPTYAATDINMLAGVLEVARRHDVRTATQVALERLILVLACHYHRPTLALAPPHYRAYHGSLIQYAGGVAPYIFKMTRDRRLVEPYPAGLHDVHMNFAAAVLDLRISKAMRKLFLDKEWPFEVREVQGYLFPKLRGNVNSWPEVTSFYPDHEQRGARILTAGLIDFDEAKPGMDAATYMTGTYALGTFSTRGLSSPFGYGKFHTRGFQFYYRPRKDAGRFPARFGFLAFPNAEDEGADNDVECVSQVRQHKNVALALYRMAPRRTHACELFCPLQAADGREEFFDSCGPLSPGHKANGPLFVLDGEVYLAFLAEGRPSWRVESLDPDLTGYTYYQSKAIPSVTLRHYRGKVKNFRADRPFCGGFAVVMGDADEYGDLDAFRRKWSKARLTRKTRGARVELVLSGVAPALRLRSTTDMRGNPELFVSGRPIHTDTLECHWARQSLRGEPLTVGPYAVESSGKPVTAYAAPDGSGCVVLQPLPIPVDVSISLPDGKVKVRGLPLARAELETSPPSLKIAACSAPERITTSGSLSRCPVDLRP